MRPIDRGPIPLGNGQPKRVSNYRSWRADLLDRIGPYCCFCNMRLNDSPQVEHVIAQAIDSSLALDWDNMLLACGPCNRTKSHTPCPPATHYLPQFHNTHLAFDYKLSALLIANQAAAFVYCKSSGIDPIKGQNTISLCALDRDTTKNEDQATDLRWKYRFEALTKAKIWRAAFEELSGNFIESFVNLLQTAVESTGFWSIWFTTFEDIPEVRKMLVQNIPGTDAQSFDAGTFKPISRTTRPSGDVI